VGVDSLVLGLALQAPLSNLFSCFYFLTRTPCRVGARIMFGGASADVINVGFLGAPSRLTAD
jgi:small-conductance mechanosensitive channel